MIILILSAILWDIQMNRIYIEIICIEDAIMSFAIHADILVMEAIFLLKSQTFHVIELTC